eukprot:2555830-Rhodomonas_salina.1
MEGQCWLWWGVVTAWVVIAAATLHLASVDVLVLFMHVNMWITKCHQQQAAVEPVPGPADQCPESSLVEHVEES